MRAREARYFAESGVKSIDAMERAAEALADAVRETVPAGARVWCVCGSGGNGGDGIACARILKDEYEARIVVPKMLKSADAIENLRRAEQAGVPISDEISEEPALWVDALLGTGLSREPDGAYARWIDRMNESAAPVIAADIPSGLNGATGRAYGHCVRAIRTVAFGFGKAGLFLQDGLEASGEVTIAPIGFPESAFKSEITLMDAGDVARFLPKRPRNIYKNQCGHLLIVAGSFGMAGAAAMCARGAMRTGVGLVTIACPESIVTILQTLVPGAMCVPLPEKDGAIAEIGALRRAFAGKTAVIIGCGLSMRANPDAVRAVLESGLPAVIDADALNLIAENGMQGLLRAHHVITPHTGEARRLLRSAEERFGRTSEGRGFVGKGTGAVNGECVCSSESTIAAENVSGAESGKCICASESTIASKNMSDAVDGRFGVKADNATDGRSGVKADDAAGGRSGVKADDAAVNDLLRDPIAAAHVLSGFGACALFKGASCAISDGVNTFVSASGCCGMARGGSGDVLSGIIGALMAEHSERSAALNAALASEIHGLAGECAERKFGQRGMVAADIPDCIPEILMENSNA